MKSIVEQVLGDEVEQKRRDLINYQKNYYESMMRMKNKPRIVQGGKKWYIMRRTEVVANDLTQAEAEALIKLMD